MECAWKAPLCLIENSDENGLVVNDDTFGELYKIKCPVSVVSIAGPCGTGKSFIMNLLADSQTGFSLDLTIQSKTKGIWAWCRPLPTRRDECLLLLDTEGLGDVQKGDTNHDRWIFTLAVLLSSTLVDISMGTIDQGALDYLRFITNMAENVKIKSGSGEEDGTEFGAFFPNFIWAIRDFTLDLEVDGKEITSDEYLKHALAFKTDLGARNGEFNSVRSCIKQFFPSRKCFTFPMPVRDSAQLRRLEELDHAFCPNWEIWDIPLDLDLDGRYITSDKYLERALETKSGMSQRVTQRNAQKMSFKSFFPTRKCFTFRRPVNDEKLFKDLETLPHYDLDPEFASLSEPEEGFLPDVFSPDESECIVAPFVDYEFQSAVDTTAQIENAHAMQESMDLYREMRKTRIGRVIIINVPHTIHADVDVDVDVLVNYFARDEFFRDKCSEVLQSLYDRIASKVEAGEYIKPGGYWVYKRDMTQLLEYDYGNTPEGIKAKETLDKWARVGFYIAGDGLDEAQKKVEDAKRKFDKCYGLLEVAHEKNRKTELWMADKEKSFQVNLKQMEKKMAAEREAMLKAQKIQLEKAREEQERLLETGLKEQASLMEQHAKMLEGMKEKSSMSDKLFGVFGNLVDVGAAGARLFAAFQLNI